MTIRFVDEAQSELLDAISDYEDARGGLGQRFKDEASSPIQLFPLQYNVPNVCKWVAAQFENPPFFGDSFSIRLF